MTHSRPEAGGYRGAAIFVACALGLAVLYWLVVTLVLRGDLRLGRLRSAIDLAANYGPTLAALIAAGVCAGRVGVRELGSRLLRFRASWSAYLFVFAVPVLALSVVVGVAAFLRPETLEPASVRWGRLAAIFVLFIFVDGPLGEEIGWRGYLLPRLLERTTALRASLVVGAVWFLWHVPHFHVDEGRVLDARFFVVYPILNVALAVLYTWLFVRSNGSSGIAVLFHTVCNFAIFATISVLPGLRDAGDVRVLYTATISALAVLVVLSWRRRSAQLGSERRSEETRMPSESL